MAATLLGVARPEEEPDMRLRYFDQSHVIRDFTTFFGVTPEKFRAKPRPLLKVTLEQREAGETVKVRCAAGFDPACSKGIEYSRRST